MKGVRFTLLALSGCLLAGTGAHAMGRWAALSMIETGNNDRAVGSHGEISRYQIRPKLWPGGNPRNSRHALAAAQEVMHPRVQRFERIHGRAPTDFEFYVLWNAPREVNHPSKVVRERARRYSNLVHRQNA